MARILLRMTSLRAETEPPKGQIKTVPPKGQIQVLLPKDQTQQTVNKSVSCTNNNNNAKPDEATAG